MSFSNEWNDKDESFLLMFVQGVSTFPNNQWQLYLVINPQGEPMNLQSCLGKVLSKSIREESLFSLKYFLSCQFPIPGTYQNIMENVLY